MKILFYSRSYKNLAGGIERKSLEIAKGLVDRGHQVDIVSLDSSDDLAFYDWPENVTWHKVNIGDPMRKASLKERVRRIMFLRNLLKRDFEVAVGFQVGAFALLKLSALGLKVGIIAAERNAPTLFEYIGHGKMKRFFSNLILVFSDKIAILFPEFKKYYPSYLQNKFVITPNWVDVTRSDTAPTQRRNDSQILYVGRFSYQKNIDCLLDAAKLLHPEIELVLVGSGDGYTDVEAKASSLNLNCKFVAPTRDLSSYYESATLLCLPSRWEGFPNVAAEALAAGLPVVGFAECAGLPELIFQGKSGELAFGNEDSKSLSTALNIALKRNYSEEFIKDSVAGYSYINFISAWETACRSVIRKKS
jgi:GalNAc-alpha-(1->4)-GalNAc-alpha-(1->3)-diNAcBac-PP-undecaprenol alpha-1,4-N-acetyl-D-galactosaminyltransferase